MERLTRADWKQINPDDVHPRYKRLAEYEDIGLTPEEVMAYKVKVGETVYYVPNANYVRERIVHERKVHEWKVVCREALISWIEEGQIGKTLFLDREQAEAALKRLEE